MATVVAVFPLAAASTVVQYVAPAGTLPAGHLKGAIYDAVLPSGRIVTPFGASVVTGMNALGFTLTPDGRFAIVSNADSLQPRTRSIVDPTVLGGNSLAVVDTATLRIADRFVFPDETYSWGVAAVSDPRFPARTLIFAAGGTGDRVDVLDLDQNGHVTPDLRHVIELPPSAAAPAGGLGRGRPATLLASPDGRHVYALDAGGDSVTVLDTAARTAGASRSVGYSPSGAALAGDRLLVTNEGLMPYARVAEAPLVPPFGVPPADPLRGSSLSLVGLGPDGDFAPLAPVGPQALAMDVWPDGLRIAGGAHPSAIAVTPDAAYAFVAMTSVDRIATVRLTATPLVAGGTELRLFDRGPYGTQPAALALSRDGTRLYAALAGLNAIAVLDARDPLHLHRLGLIPTGWLPTALALSPDDRTLYVVNTNGFGHDIGSTGDSLTGADATAVWSTLQKIDLGDVMLSSTTFTTLKNTRETRSIPPAYPPTLRDVVVVVAGQASFDSLLGDLEAGPSDPKYLRFGAATTPNLHALAQRYAVAGNLFADAGEPDAAHEFMTAGLETVYSRRTRCAPAGCSTPSHGDDPADFPRAGSIYQNLARHHVSFRDYGDSLRLSGYDDGEATDRIQDDPGYSGSDAGRAPTRGLGGRYRLNVPAAASLAGHADLDYPGWNPHISNERRADEFIRDYGTLVNARRQPRYTRIWLPADYSSPDADGSATNARVAADDRALGAIVQFLTRLRSWKNTVIFVLPQDVRSSRDHVDENRTYALVISPFAKRHYTGMRHLSSVSVLKTSEQILHLPPLSLGDLLATDMSDFFTPLPDARPYAGLDSR